MILFCSVQINAHSAQISTMTLAQNQQKEWTLHISSSFDGFRNQLVQNFPEVKIDELSADEFQKLIIQYVKDNILINANIDFVGELKEGAIKLGHQTDMKFRIIGLPEDIKTLLVKLNGFDEKSNYNSVFKIVTQAGTSKNFVLKKANGFQVSIEKVNDKFQLTIDEQSLVWPFAILAFLVLFALLTVYRMFKNEPLTLRPV
ncbi:hypothetical protein B0O79_2788 [Flavobacteriaceae bacterium MAR_2009_75]|nr:hypothetical protein B0O79_2788 [Flavobacteriaceae bacterium MAR_2009_75]